MTQNDHQARRPTARQDDEEMGLVAAVRARDLRAFEQLYRRYQPRLSRFVGTLLRSPGLVEEVVNDTLMVLWQKASDFTGASRLSTWLFAIAYRKAVRARAREPLAAAEDAAMLAEVADDSSADAGLSRDRTRQALQRAMGVLSAEHRAVVDLTYFHEIGYREIAEILGCPVDTVKTRMFHARRQLRRAMAGELADWI
ncbi:sigma-70 family RNA polymerase sigma factor [Sphingomonas sp. ABOLD]|uniref:RNA polymerase sigma factor n=1 Tax=Sphingomonas sp. ABOLD TaxID=1985877 RepID=UPI001F49A1D0|nr:sigma-70 family RNA polymerase sigma factor [Sphingomonas sp. ABOLD]